MARSEDQLADYRRKRDFRQTAEPKGSDGHKSGHLYVIQKHDASQLHYDLRLQVNGVLKSWAIPKGPSLDPSDKRLAIMTEDHPVEYGDFEGVIRKGYGAGTVMLWDRGSWEPESDADEGLEKGELKFTLDGERLKGRFVLVHMKGEADDDEDNWLLIKEKDGHASKEDPLTRWQDSVVSGRDLGKIAESAEDDDTGAAT